MRSPTLPKTRLLSPSRNGPGQCDSPTHDSAIVTSKRIENFPRNRHFKSCIAPGVDIQFKRRLGVKTLGRSPDWRSGSPFPPRAASLLLVTPSPHIEYTMLLLLICIPQSILPHLSATSRFNGLSARPGMWTHVLPVTQQDRVRSAIHQPDPKCCHVVSVHNGKRLGRRVLQRDATRPLESITESNVPFVAASPSAPVVRFRTWTRGGRRRRSARHQLRFNPWPIDRRIPVRRRQFVLGHGVPSM